MTGVKHGCLLSPLLFTFCIDWIMCHKRTGIIWGMTEELEDLDFADDIALLSHRQRNKQEKTTKLAKTAETISLHINATKTKITKGNTVTEEPVTLNSTRGHQLPIPRKKDHH